MKPLPTIKDLRVRANMTQAQLAAAAHVSASTIAHWEQYKATPFLDELRRVCAVLGVRMDQVALSPHERLLTTHDLIYQLKAREHEDETWRATVIGLDSSGFKLYQNQHPNSRGRIPGPMDLADPRTDTVVVPVTWKWEATAPTMEAAFQLLSDQIVEALDRATVGDITDPYCLIR